MSTSGIKSFACVPSRRGETAVSQHKLLKNSTEELKVVPLRRTKRMVKGSNCDSSSRLVSMLETKKILGQCTSLQALQTQVESKESVPRFRGSDSPMPLCEKHPGYAFIDTKESLLLVDTMRSFFSDKHYRFRISTALNMSSSASGAVNSTISCSTLTSNTIFVALSSVFNEFFVERFDCHWEPVSEYNFPLTGLPDGKTISSLPLGVGTLQHGQTAYTSLSTMTNNYGFSYHNTARPFVSHWKNVESSSVPTVVTTTAVTQGWTSVGNVANYLGSLQYLSQAAPPGLPVSSVLGTFQVNYQVLFRVKV